MDTRVRHNPAKPWALSIIDPNRSDNDISSGSSNVRLIFECFSEAYATLQSRMHEPRTGRPENGSILSSLYAGDYTSFETQRAHMKRLYTER